MHLYINQFWKVGDNVSRGERFLGVTGCPKHFHSVGDISFFDFAITRNAIQHFLSASQTETGSIKSSRRTKKNQLEGIVRASYHA
jgi:hypothetical protein